MYALAWGLTVVVVAFALIVKRKRTRREEIERIQMSVDELSRQNRPEADLIIFDLRHPLEVLASPHVIPGAINIDPKELDQHVAQISRNAALVLYCTCPNEETSLRAYRQMKERGFRRVRVLSGGLPAWKSAGLPLQDLYPVAEPHARHQAAG